MGRDFSSRINDLKQLIIISGLLKNFNIAPRASAIFANVDDNAWFAEAFINAHYNGIEMPADIDPNKVMTREEFTHYLVSAFETIGQKPMVKIAPVPITDEADINPEYQGSIQRSLLWKINSIRGDEKFNPKSEITREEAAIMLFNAIEYLEAYQKSAETAPE
ncbi:S-layer homology domain-containing protein [Paenibacillus eucommiae]|uniref:SLH domain-containing protein n=1 Tax=Paenibacillus eucommiae TaxID=1355755 RepID=A0ABS4IXU0_9BACL|nr:hypothetical protein [Paenibacillus eucommiae]MBP1991706.1 hypothetical protein [Paenibacillus eucommiae]